MYDVNYSQKHAQYLLSSAFISVCFLHGCLLVRISRYSFMLDRNVAPNILDVTE